MPGGKKNRGRLVRDGERIKYLKGDGVASVLGENEGKVELRLLQALSPELRGQLDALIGTGKWKEAGE